MSTSAIFIVSVCALLGWGSLMQAIEAVAKARAKAARCPCHDLHSITVSAPTFTRRLSADGDEEVATEHRSIVVAAGKVH